ncbi:C4-type zinc ribbon domain-containing protein [Candidatus Acetothermia bacterium]|jgi:predicted  nucleic acid-binding Zn-ribbon protein|nr:C4-type zinc ribbon domain-containing protein [Candidatus Acetothermia bacterium]MCI2432166.1 C4-type zinc ribbon domain-containing protein [Candidatus Acetothermia bacterium]MCI2436141.1 C4-type zinc ribbon domain-containing protein [Candidatus Acetothermia bacterium]
MLQELERLLLVQQHDLELREISEKIAALQQRRASLQQAFAREDADFAAQKKQFEELKRRSRERSAEVDDLDAQVRQDEQKLKSGLTSYKEMEALRRRIEQNRQRTDELSDAALALITQVEEEEPKIHAAQEAFLKWKRKIDEELAQIDEEITVQQRTLTVCQERRAVGVAQIEPGLLQQYEHLRQRHVNPIALVQSGICSGCHLRVSESVLERLREGAEIVTCENCSRLLYMK